MCVVYVEVAVVVVYGVYVVGVDPHFTPAQGVDAAYVVAGPVVDGCVYVVYVVVVAVAVGDVYVYVGVAIVCGGCM